MGTGLSAEAHNVVPYLSITPSRPYFQSLYSSIFDITVRPHPRRSLLQLQAVSL